MGSIVYNGVLLSAGTGELLFFQAAGTVLCFGFSMRIMLVTHWYFGYCWAVLTLNPEFSVSHVLAVSRCTRSCEGACPGQQTWMCQRDILSHRASHGQRINWGDWSAAADCSSGTGWALVRVWWAIVLGITSVSWGLFLSPLLSAFSLLLIIAIWFCFTG